MKIINNITEKLSDDLHVEISPHSKVSIAAACFSVYAYEELKEQLEQVDIKHQSMDSCGCTSEKIRCLKSL